jgi:RNA 2',3'-cyclic 3'-phosphodiesterase
VLSERKHRLFVGIELDDSAREACADVSARVRQTGFDARYEAAEKLHVTLAFLGHVAVERQASVLSALGPAASGETFSVALDKLGGFPHERRPRVVYVGARDGGAPIRELAERVRGAYAALGFEFKNDSVAHVTIARVKAPARPLPLLEFLPIPLRVERLTLFESLPDPANTTSRYESIASVPLRVARSDKGRELI